MKTQSLLSASLLALASFGAEGFSAAKNVDAIKVIGKVEVNIQEGPAFAIEGAGSEVKVSYEKGVSGDNEKVVVENKDGVSRKLSIRLPRLSSLEIRNGVVAHAELKAGEELALQSATSKATLHGSLGKMELSSTESDLDLSRLDLSRMRISSSGDRISLKVTEIRGAINNSQITCGKVPQAVDVVNVKSSLSNCK